MTPTNDSIATLASQEGHSRVLFTASTILLGLCGLGIIVLNSWSVNNEVARNANLTRMLWRFEPSNAAQLYLQNQRVAWYKLLLAGFMMASLFVSLSIRFLDPVISIASAATLWLGWIAYLFYYWSWLQSTDTKKNSEKSYKSEEPFPRQGEESSAWAERFLANKASSSSSSSFSTDAKEDKRLPVTIVTGFLGSGKTTLVKRILTNTIGMKVLVIENEVGNEGIDHDLLMQQTNKEDIILMNNGCICCNVRNDLLQTFHKMFTKDAFALLDWIVIETTGLADPAPLIQSFYMDPACQQRMRVDSVLTVVDCKHLPLHLTQHAQQQSGGAHGGVSEAILQISFADRILLNKTDLIMSQELAKLQQQILEINSSATIFTCQYSNVDIKEVLNVKGFDVKRSATIQSLLNNEHSKERPLLIQRDAQGKILRKNIKFSLSSSTSNTSTSNTAAKVSTISLVTDEAIDLNKFNTWIADVLQRKGPDMYRLKGILSMHGYDEQFICHGVHMIFEGERGPLWSISDSRSSSSEKRRSRLVIIGKGLVQEEWEQGFIGTIYEGSSSDL